MQLLTNMRFFKSALSTLVALSFLAFTPLCKASHCDNAIQFAPAPTSYIPTYTEEELRSRLKEMTNSVIPPRYTSVVKGYVDTYTIKRRDKTEKMLGRTTIYFPMFEQYLAEHGLPQDLKHLSVVESALNPDALSRSGAAGLWQFMPPTGQSLGLRISSYIDDRKDPHKSTEAALIYLKKQYDRFGSWELALAAYNGGPGRVSRAIKRGRSKNFWKITRYLPRETRNYVPAFIAASYIAEYHHLHGLSPVYPEQGMVNTALTKVYDEVSFLHLSEITGTPYHIVAALNPSYKRSFIPRNQNGNNLVLPQAAMANYLNYIGRPDHKLNQMMAASVAAPNNEMVTKDRAVSSHQVKANEDLNSIATIYNCSAEDLIQWNKLHAGTVRQGQYLMLFLDKYPTTRISYQPLVGLSALDMQTDFKAIKGFELPKSAIPQTKINSKFSNTRAKGQNEYVYHKMKRRETLAKVVGKYPGVTLEEVMKLNQINQHSRLKPGMKIKIKKK